MPELLLELFSEEIPARMQARAAEDLARLFSERCAALLDGAPRTFCGPRRIGLAATLKASVTTEGKEERGPRVGAPELADLAALDDAAFRARFAGSPIKRIGRDRFVRNVLYAIGNSGLPRLRPSAEALCGDPDPVVAEAAAWAVARLSAHPFAPAG